MKQIHDLKKSMKEFVERPLNIYNNSKNVFSFRGQFMAFFTLYKE